MTALRNLATLRFSVQLPAPHLVIPDYLPPETLASPLAWTLQNEVRFQPRRLAGGGDDPDQARALKLNDLGPFQPLLLQRVRKEYKEWTRALRMSTFECESIELRMAAYKDGGSFAYHRDISSDPSAPEASRALTGVFYYHRMPRRYEGGTIRLFGIGADPAGDAYQELEPRNNSLLLFPSWIGHQVMPVRCASADFADCRFSVNYWLHRAAPIGAPST